MLLIIIVFCIMFLLLFVRMAQEYQRAVIFRFGRAVGERGPGLYCVIPLVERAVKVDIRVMTRELDTQETVTRDGVAVKVNAVMWYRAGNATQTVVQVENWHYAVKQVAETSMRDAIGQNELDNLLKDRERANAALLSRLQAAVEGWGVKVDAVELKDLDIPQLMQRAIAKEAEAVREKRARIIKAEGELEASEKLSLAAAKMSHTPGAMELRRLQTLAEIGTEHNSTIVLALGNETGLQSVGNTIGIAKAFSENTDKPSVNKTGE